MSRLKRSWDWLNGVLEQNVPRENITSGKQKRAQEELDIADRALRRFGLFGNAGGTIATLSLIGSTIGSNSARSDGFPSAAFWVLIVFLAGLLFAAIEVIATELRSRAYLGPAEEISVERTITTGLGKDPEIRLFLEHFALPRYTLLSWLKDLSKWVSLLSFAVGVVAGLFALQMMM